MGATDRWRERIVLDVPGEVLIKILEVPDFNRPDRGTAPGSVDS